MMRTVDAGVPRVLPRVTPAGLSATAFADIKTRFWLDGGAVTGIPDRGHARLDHVYRGAAGQGARDG